MFQTEASAGLTEDLGAKRRAVVGQYCLEANAQGCEIGYGVFQKLHRASLAFIGIHIGEGDARMIVDGDKQVFPPGPDGVTRATRDALAHALDASELLGVDMQQIARRFVLVGHAHSVVRVHKSPDRSFATAPPDEAPG